MKEKIFPKTKQTKKIVRYGDVISNFSQFLGNLRATDSIRRLQITASNIERKNPDREMLQTFLFEAEDHGSHLDITFPMLEVDDDKVTEILYLLHKMQPEIISLKLYADEDERCLGEVEILYDEDVTIMAFDESIEKIFVHK